jgi:DNA polymerase-3 subunit gamma/tau
MMATREKNSPNPKSQAAGLKPQAGYTVLARRYRSRDFDELIGQEPIARTLLNAIKTDRVAHAYLFCGTRGVGKTSMARIFAKALNATGDLKERDAIGQAILRGEDLDVIEIDGASYRGVNEARDLIAGAGLLPTRSPYKIYIIDEVHQLTRDAFNALLKTMEEPPRHVKFILCTTEPHKVPATIQSRCQRFDFRAISSAKIAEQIRRILKEEGIKADDEVVARVARLGNGSMRDALSILDRLLAGGEERLTVEHLEEMLGLPDHQLIVNLVDAFIASDPASALKAGDELLQRSAGVEQALDMLTDHLRNLMIIAACGGAEQADFLDLSDEHREIAARQAGAFDAQALVHMLAICDALARNARSSTTGRALFDAALARLAMSQHFADIPALLTGKAPPLPPGTTTSRRAVAEIEPKKKDPALTHPTAAVFDPARAGAGDQPAAPQRAPAQAPHVAEVKPAAISDDQLWPRVLEVAREKFPDWQRVEHLLYQSFDGQTLRLAIDDSGADVVGFLTMQVDKIADLVRRATGRQVKIDLDTGQRDPRRAAASAARASPTDAGAPLPAMVGKAAELFDATVVAIDSPRG